MNDAYICDAIRTPIGRYGGALSSVRTDDLAAIPIKALMDRNPNLDWTQVEDVFYGSANQAGEDNRNVARMAGLLAGLPVNVGGCTLNRLCASGMDAIGTAARAIKSGDIDLAIAGGVESMSRAPMVMPKAEAAFSRQAEIFDTTIGWRFINPKMHQKFGTDSMPETAENVAQDYQISRADQDAFALRSQQRAAQSQAADLFAREICPVSIARRKQSDLLVEHDEQPRESTLEGLAKLPTPFRAEGSVTAGNASSVNDGACALLLASEQAVQQHGLKPRARILAMASAGVEPRVMGIGPIDAINKVLTKAGLNLTQIDLIELNEAFAAQGLAITRSLGIADDDPRVNPQGGAIALGHPLGMSGARLVTTAVNQLERHGKRYALCTMCVGVGQGLAIVIEKV
ncbi:MAG: 3-oxoadipyl-CoA thiolase [Gammaproteobacteria bacterium]|nr:3-oxoadipyl-CoA thiolase [Gammaproteobacteria bacterium]MCP4881620.1 3-oxoadipyl-CoA thiolase [Gammaproteobacteria bacterium]MDP6166163.1 3-oxoadipyl-CoA thiolase [Gammaproteobacteria bacterium]